MYDHGKRREGEIEGSVSMETVSCVHEDVKKINENETESSVSSGADSNLLREDEEEHSFFTNFEANDLEEEPSMLTFSFRQNYIAPNVSHNLFSSNENISKVESLEQYLEEGLVSQEEQRNIPSIFTSDPISQCKAFCSSDSFDDDILNDSTVQSDSGSESCSNNNNDYSVTLEVLSSSPFFEGFGTESHEENTDEFREESQYSRDNEVSRDHNFDLLEEKNEKESSSYIGEDSMWEDKWDESDFDDEEEDDDDFEWENDEVVQQLKMELKNARQGGLSTILEEGEEAESPKVVEDLKPLKIEKKIEFKDHIVEIQKVYRCYAEKTRKLDVLNYQTMHAIGEDQINFISFACIRT